MKIIKVLKSLNEIQAYVKVPKDFLKDIKDIANISFANDKKGSEYWLDNGMYQVTYKKGNSIRFKKVLSY